jgi:hypothetical protein
MPTADLRRRPRSPQPHAVPPPVSPPEVDPRVEPTPINGYPATHAADPFVAQPAPRAPNPGEGRAAPPTPHAPHPRGGQATPPAPGGPAEAGASPDARQARRRTTAADANPAPIAKLAISGPDTEPRRYADADIGDGWFTTKQAKTTPAEASDGSVSRSAVAEAGAGSAGIPGPDARVMIGTTAGREAPAGHEPAGGHEPTAGLEPTAGHDPAAGRDAAAVYDPAPGRDAVARHDPAAGRDAAAVHHPAPGRDAVARHDPALGRNGTAGRDATRATTGPRAAAADAPAAEVAASEPDGQLADGRETSGERSSVVISVDITGLLNGMTAEQAIIVPRDRSAAEPPPGRPNQPHGDGRHPDQLHQDRDQQDDTGVPTGHAGERSDQSGHDEVSASSLMPGPVPAEPTPPVRPLTPLTAADLEAIRWRLDGATLREVVDDREALRELGVRLDEPLSEEADHVARAGVLSVRAEVYRLLGELGLAAAASRLALAHAESAQNVQAVVIAEAELAHVLRLRGDFAEADRLFEEAASSEAPERLRSVVHENAGRSCFDQGRHMEALDHFARAIRLGSPDDLDLAERIEVCLEAVYIHVLRDGWGPYPRLRSEILGQARPAKPAPDGPPRSPGPERKD